MNRLSGRGWGENSPSGPSRLASLGACSQAGASGRALMSNPATYTLLKNQIDCKAGTTAKGQNLLANISTSRASLLQGQYNAKLTALKFE